MVSARQKQTVKYGVTLLIEGSKLETVAKKIKEAVGDVKIVGSIEKIIVPGTGEWGTEWVKHEGYLNPVLVNTDGRIIKRFEKYDDEGDVIPGEYAYYVTDDAYGKSIRNADGKWHIETLEEAKSLVQETMTQAEILDAADEIAEYIVKYGAGDHEEESSLIEKSAESYLMGRGKELPEAFDAEEEGNRRTPEYVVTLRIKASTLPSIEKKAKVAFGDKLKSVEKVGRGFSRAADLAEAKEHVEAAVEIVGGLKDHMEEWRDNMPENFQQTQKYEEVEECASNLETLEEELNGVNFDIDFPGMF
jgi:hypothetical protein